MNLFILEMENGKIKMNQMINAKEARELTVKNVEDKTLPRLEEFIRNATKCGQSKAVVHILYLSQETINTLIKLGYSVDIPNGGTEGTIYW